MDGKVTIDHEEIRRWAEKYRGNPQIIDHPDAEVEHVGLRIHFPGNRDSVFLSESRPPKNITWEEFFRIFDRQGLAFTYSTRVDRKNPNSLYRFIKRTMVREEL